MNETRTLAAFVHRTAFADLSAALVEQYKLYTLDNLAAGFVGSAQPWSRIVLAMVEEGGGHEHASVFASPVRVPAARAALVNGVMIHAFEVDHVGYHAHPSGTVFPAALALGEQRHVSGRDFLTALALGYEVACRIGQAHTNAAETERGFHNPSLNGPFGAAAAAGKLLSLDADGLASAFGIAGSHCGGLTEYAWDGSMTKRLHLGRAAELGLESAFLAARGFTGPATILEGRSGFLQAYSPAPKPERLPAGLGETWVSADMTVKAYPCHVTAQAVVEALLRLKQERPFDPGKVTGLRLRASGRMLEERFWERAPTTMLGAQYSLPFAAALAVYRDLSDPLALDESALHDGNIRRLALAVQQEVAAAGELDDLAAEVIVYMSGETLTVRAESFVGSPRTSASFTDIEDKFRRYSRAAIDDQRAAAIVQTVRRLESLPDIAELATLLRAS